MFKKFVVVFSLASMLMATPFAAAAESQMDQESQTISVDNRVGKMVSLSLEPISAMDRAVAIQAGWFFSPDTILNIRAARSKYDQGGVSFDQNSLSATLKMFISNSFYVEGGLESRGFKPIDSSIDRRGQTYGPTLQAGNEWQWRYTTAGIDLFSYYTPLKTDYVGGARWDALRIYIGFAL